MIKFHLYESRVLYSFLFLMLFIAILSNRISPIIAYILIFSLVLLHTLFSYKICQYTKIAYYYLIFLIFNLYLVYLYQKIYYSSDNLYYLQFFGSQVVFFIILNFININNFIEKYFELFLFNAIILSFILIVVDYVLIAFGLVSSQLMYRENLFSYYEKPFGLFGQPSVNATYLVVFFMLYLAFFKETKYKKKIFLFILVSISLILQNSGSGYLLYFLLISSFFYKNILFKLFLLPFIFMTFIYIIMNNFIDKISIDYILLNYEYFSLIIISMINDNFSSIYDVLFGINPSIDFPIDFGPAFLIAKVGLLFFISYTILLIYMLYKNKNTYFRMSIISLVISNLHYPVLFYPVMNVILPILFIYTINQKNSSVKNNGTQKINKNIKIGI